MNGGMAVSADISNKIPPHGLIHNWLGSEAVEGLLRFARSNESRFEDTTVAFKEGQGIDRTRRVSKRLQSLGIVESELRGRLDEVLPAMFNRLGNEPFIPSNIEVEFVVHGDGAFFARHVDTIAHNPDHGGHSRVFSAVYYFNALPKAFSGGVLRLYSLAASGQQGTFVDIKPNRDMLIFFPSFFPHEVLPVKCPSGQFLDSRFAINFWVHRK
jgi:Rps23 Pro-64 3,4-dihydroxylase Tpa1-like proline 4-hydroxylase